MGLCLLLVFTLIFFQASAFPLHNRFPSENKLVGEETEPNRNVSNVVGRKDVAPHTTIARGFGESTGGSHGNGEAGNGGESATPTTSGGSAASVIPIIGAAGAVNNHHQSAHHGAASCNRCFVGFFSFMAAIFSLLALQLSF